MRITGLDLIDHRDNAVVKGRVTLVYDDAVSISYQLQDEGRTLKLFIEDSPDKRAEIEMLKQIEEDFR